jgi:hypothetical protein
LLYNLGFGVYANIPYFSWAMTSQNLFPSPKTVTLYANGDVLSTVYKRDPELEARDFNSSIRGVLNSIGDGHELTEPTPAVIESKVVTFDNGTISSYSGLSVLSNFSDSLTGMSLLRRQSDGGETIDDGQNPDFSLAQSLTCPPTSCAPLDGSGNPNQPACNPTLPDFRSKPAAISTNDLSYSPLLTAYKVNCNLFKDAQASGNSKTILVSVFSYIFVFFPDILRVMRHRHRRSPQSSTGSWDLHKYSRLFQQTFSFTCWPNIDLGCLQCRTTPTANLRQRWSLLCHPKFYIQVISYPS